MQTTPPDPVSPTGSPPASPARRLSRESPARLALYAAGGAAVIYIATWSGSIFFFLFFQQKIAAGKEHPQDGVLWSVARTVPAGTTAPWPIGNAGGFALPLPPGKLDAVRHEGDVVIARFLEGEISYQEFPPGFLVSLLSEKLQSFGGEIPPGSTDARVLEEVMRTTPGEYRFLWPGPERRAYAGRILTKLLLWEDHPARRVEVASRQEAGAAAALVAYETGETRVVAAGRNGVRIVQIAAGAPASWSASPASWLSR